MIKETKYEGEDQLIFAHIKTGHLFNHWVYIYPEALKDEITCPFTIKTNEKTRILIIDSSNNC